ncbi:MAG: glycosyl hydrolase 53 family protein [Candidatus Micrarchaeota archaeon]
MRVAPALVAVCIILFSGCVQETSQPEAPAVPEPPAEAPAAGQPEQIAGPGPAETLEGDSRSFYVGVVPNPKGGADAGWEEVVEAYNETKQIAEVTMLWTNPGGIGQYNRIRETRAVEGARLYGLEPVITLSFATIKEVHGEGLKYVIDAPEGVEPSLADPEFRRLYKMEARSIADEFRPQYMSLGNEINDYFILNPDEYPEYLTLFGETYSEIKEVSPETKVFIVFSYTHLIDNGQWDMIEDFDGRADLIGLTTYPWHHFENPDGIGADYYSRLSRHTGKPIAFTEIGWPSAEDVGSSEMEQKRFLEVFLERTDGMDMEMVNWLFLHDTLIEGVAGSVSDEAVGTVALRNMDGSKKAVHAVWFGLKEREYSE